MKLMSRIAMAAAAWGMFPGGVMNVIEPVNNPQHTKWHAPGERRKGHNYTYGGRFVSAFEAKLRAMPLRQRKAVPVGVRRVTRVSK